MLIIPQCYFNKCEHYLGTENKSEPFDESKEFNCCEAFPEGIPDEIAYGDNDHTKPFNGDNGIQFSKKSV